MKKAVLLIFFVVLLVSCTENPTETSEPILNESVSSQTEESKPWYSTGTPDNTSVDESITIENSTEESIEESIEVSSDISIEASIPDEPIYPDDNELVLISDYIPDIALDIRYATANNFTGEVIYESADAYLKYGTVKKLILVQNELKEYGYGLLIWDAYRPPEAQWKLWEVCPDPNFVSDPNKGISGHSRGDTVDVTLIDLKTNTELTMPSAFDEFGATADRDYSDVSITAAENAKLLEDIMTKHGFSGYRKEWWHYSDKAVSSLA